MNLEMHILQNFVPSNLNRDDTGTPKDCVFGGVRRARVSSQCVKRSIRLHPSFSRKIEEAGGDVGKRTKLIRDEIAKLLIANGTDQNTGKAAAAGIVHLLGLKFEKPKGENTPAKTQYLLYLGQNEVRELADLASRTEVLNAASDAFGQHGETWDKVAETIGKSKDLGDVAKQVKSVVNNSRLGSRAYAADIALFGRMVADDKDMNVDAACQVAHAISTNRADIDIDFYTAVDDFNVEDAGAGMMGTSEFTSSCFYRYMNLDLDKLGENLAHNRDLMAATVCGFVEAAVKAIPSGKQNSSAAQNPPCYVRTIIRDDGFPWSLAGAFSKPVQSNGSRSLEEESADRLEEHFGSMRSAYGADGIQFDELVSTLSGRAGVSLSQHLANLDGFVSRNLQGQE